MMENSSYSSQRTSTSPFRLLLFISIVSGYLVEQGSCFVLFKRNRLVTSDHTLNMKQPEGAVWCPEQQIYVGGVVPDNAEVESLLKENGGALRIFGYGSLCWNPGDGALAKEGVTTKLGRAQGYKRCWAQKSADHRGTPTFPGIVCTLLRDEEVNAVRGMRGNSKEQQRPSTTEGVIYTIPPHQVDDCLEELDFREKGGYARDVIDVVEYDSGKTVKALLYRGTPDNPAFWPRTLLDLPYAAAVMSVSTGPSGKNIDYLSQLDVFMSDPKVASPTEVTADYDGDTDTSKLASMAKLFQENTLFFLFGSGSNQHNQLLLGSDDNNACLVNGEDAHELKEIVLCAPTGTSKDVKKIVGGGGHSGLLTNDGSLFLWGWNSSGQLGRPPNSSQSSTTPPLPVIPRLASCAVEDVALGFGHTVVIEKGSGRLLAFGDNERGQVLGSVGTKSVAEPTTPAIAKGLSFVRVAAGLFHSAAVTTEGDLITFGCLRFGQSLPEPWRPNDGSRIVDVACGRRHTVALDEHGRVWTMGESKRGQLGRNVDSNKGPGLVDGFLGEKQSGCVRVGSGWSHTIATVETPSGESHIYGWGRNDKGQLGFQSPEEQVSTPTRLFQERDVKDVACGSECTVIQDVNQTILGCGWNEHGNLATGNDQDAFVLQKTQGAPIVSPGSADDILMAVGGGHLLTMKR